MLPKGRITITIDEQGNIHSQIEGVEGPACEALAKLVAELGQVTEEGKTGDYYKTPKQTVRAGR